MTIGEVKVKSGATSALISSFFLFISLILGAVLNFGTSYPKRTDPSNPFNIQDLKSKWEHNRDIFPLYQANAFFFSLVKQ